jgi:hypothetical protein
MSAVTVTVATVHLSVHEAITEWEYVWQVERKPPEPEPHHIVWVVSQKPVSQLGSTVAGDMISMQKRDGTSYHNWHVLATVVKEHTTSGHLVPPLPNRKGYPHFIVLHRK